MSFCQYQRINKTAELVVMTVSHHPKEGHFIIFKLILKILILKEDD